MSGGEVIGIPDRPFVSNPEGTPKAEDPPRLLLNGLDSLYVCYSLDMRTSKLDFPDLEYRKEMIRDGRRDFEELTLGSERFLLRPNGVKPYRFVLDNDAFSLGLTEIMQPTLKAQFRSEALWRSGAVALHQRIIDWARSISATVIAPESVSRADWAFDFDLPDVDFSEGHFATRARKDAKYRDGGRAQTFRLGSGHTVIRIYDKVAEIEQSSGKVWFFELWGQAENVWRVEFQIRGERLKVGAIRTLDDLEDLQGDILRQLAHEHTSLRRPTGDSNKSRWPLHPLWQSLQNAIAEMPQLGLARHYDPDSALQYRKFKIVNSMYGYLKALAALSVLESGHWRRMVTLEDLAEEILDMLLPHHIPSIWQEDVEQRIRDYESGKW